MPSLSFDRVAHAYDATRGFPPGVDQQIAKAIVDTVYAKPETTFMEVGVGTGRIAFPLASLGHIYTGVDISEKMVKLLAAKLLANSWKEYEQEWGSLPDENGARTHSVRRFREAVKHASMRLVLSDMTALPFHDASFDIVLAVHVFHLVDGWQQAGCEVLRVLRPGGAFLHCWDEFARVEKWPVVETWGKIVHALGGEVRRPGATRRAAVTVRLKAEALQPQEVPVVERAVKQRGRGAVGRVAT